MIRQINCDPTFLSQKAKPVTKADLFIVTDLLDTLKANKERCVGMAANMIGENKQIIACQLGPFFVPMIEPKIVKKAKPYKTTEGCLSLPGQKETTRYEVITVKYLDEVLESKRQEFSGFPAQIIQHEIDHLNGILI